MSEPRRVQDSGTSRTTRLRMRLIGPWGVLAACLVIVMGACDSPIDPDPATLTGSWSPEHTLTEYHSLSIVLDDQDGSLTGFWYAYGLVDGQSQALEGSIVGERSSNEVSLLLREDAVFGADIEIHGAWVDTHEITGSITGFATSEPIRLIRSR